MYSRKQIWQTPNIASQSESGWDNFITFDYPCIDFRLKLTGYGWKPLITDSNIPVLYEGKYYIYYRLVGETVWNYLSTVVSERADFSSSYVYEDIFVESGLLTEGIYEVKISAVDAEKFASWTGVVEGITSGGVFWYDALIRADRPSGIMVYENISVQEFMVTGQNEFGFLKQELHLVSEYVNIKLLNIIDLFIYETIKVSEYNPIVTAYSLNVWDDISHTENIFSSIPVLPVYVFDGVIILEAINNFQPTNTVFVLENIHPSEVVSLNIPVALNVYDSVSHTENPVFYFTSWNIVVNNTVSISENISTFGISKISVYDAVSHTENFNATWDDLGIFVWEDIPVYMSVVRERGIISINVNETVYISEFKNQYLDVLNINKFDLITVTEFKNQYLTILHINKFDSITHSETITTLGISKISVYDTINHTEFADEAPKFRFVNVYDSIGHTEIVLNAFSILLVNVYNSVGHTEFVSHAPKWLNVSINESINVSTIGLSNPSGTGTMRILLHAENNVTDSSVYNQTTGGDPLQYSSSIFRWQSYSFDFTYNYGYCYSTSCPANNTCWNIVKDTTEWTISCWLYMKSSTHAGGGLCGAIQISTTKYWNLYVSWSSIFHKWSIGFEAHKATGGWMTQFESSAVIVDERWTHIAFTKVGAGSAMGIYVNGIQVAFGSNFFQGIDLSTNVQAYVGYATNRHIIDAYIDEFFMCDYNYFNSNPVMQGFPGFDTIIVPNTITPLGDTSTASLNNISIDDRIWISEYVSMGMDKNINVYDSIIVKYVSCRGYTTDNSGAITILRFDGTADNEYCGSITVLTNNLTFDTSDYKFGQSAVFDGATTYAKYSNSSGYYPEIMQGGSNYTMMFWVKGNGSNNSLMTQYGYTGRNERWEINQQSGYLNFRIYNSSNQLKTTTMITYDSSIWNYCVLYFDNTGNTIYVFVNGAYTSQSTWTKVTPYGANYLWIGCDRATANFWTGHIDDFVLYYGNRYGVTGSNYYNAGLVPVPVTEYPAKDTANISPYWLSISVNDAKTITENIATGVV